MRGGVGRGLLDGGGRGMGGGEEGSLIIPAESEHKDTE